MGALPRWRRPQWQAAGGEGIIKEDSHEQKSDYEDRGKIRTWLATGISGLGEDGAVSFRTFLTRTFLVLARVRGATASEDYLRLGVSFAVLGWICMMLFEGGGAFLPKRTTGAIGEKRKGDPSSFVGSGPSSCCRNERQDQKGFNKVKSETLVEKQYLSSGYFIFGMNLLQHRTQSSSENVGFPHRPPPLKIGSRRSEG
jgi:hypothetical protein